MTPGLATRRALDRAARRHAADEQRSMELIAGLVVIALVAVVGTVGVLLVGAVVDSWTGLQVVSDLLRAARGAQ